MRTNSLKELSKLPGKMLVGRYYPGSRFIRAETYTDEDILVKHVSVCYRKGIEQQKERLRRETQLMYGKVIYYPERELSDRIQSFRRLTLSTGKGLDEIAKTVQDAIGYPCAFFTRYHAPVDPQRILKAYYASLEGVQTYQLENILYF